MSTALMQPTAPGILPAPGNDVRYKVVQDCRVEGPPMLAQDGAWPIPPAGTEEAS